MTQAENHKFALTPGPFIALAIVLLWATCLAAGLTSEGNLRSPLTWLLVLVQMHLYTGLFITAHDAMHGTVAPGRKGLNDGIGTLCALLVAYNWFPRLKKQHYKHHYHVATGEDPDYHHGNFFVWYLNFLKNYITWYQLVLMAVSFNVLMLFFPERNVALFWMIPAILSTLQLFYFGTYLPHRGEHAPENPHKARSQNRNHLWAFLSCYFFGYHFEHHDKPFVPWWQLHKHKPL